MDPDQGRRPSIRVTLSVSVCLPACLPVCLSVCLLQDTLKNQQRKKNGVVTILTLFIQPLVLY